MHGKTSTPILLPVLFLLAAFVLPAGAADGGIPWGDNIPVALREAVDSQRPVMVDIWAVWCVPCKEMDETTYRDPAVIGEAEGFVPLKVDADVMDLFIERYRIDAYPTLLFLDGEGREISRWRGAIAAGPLAELLGAIGGGYAEYRSTVDKTDDPQAVSAVADYLTAAGNPERAISHLRASLKALKKAEPATREAVELLLGRAQLEAGETKAARKTLQRLADSTSDEAMRDQALAELERAG